MSKVKFSQKGFTVVELLVATAAFSLILLLCTAGLIQIGRMYYKGVISSKTQETARSVIDEISRPIQFDNKNPVAGPSRNVGGFTFQSFCIDDLRYSYVINANIRHGLWRDRTDDGSCQPLDLTQANPSAGVSNSTEGRELLGTGMRLSQLEFSTLDIDLVEIKVGIVYGDSDLLIGTVPDLRCRGSASGIGSELCATSQLSTVIKRRI